MQDRGHALRSKEDREEADWCRTVITSAMPMRTGLQEGLARVVSLPLAVCELNGKVAFENVEICRHGMGHPLRDAAGWNRENVGGDHWVGCAEIQQGLPGRRSS